MEGAAAHPYPRSERQLMGCTGVSRDEVIESAIDLLVNTMRRYVEAQMDFGRLFEIDREEAMITSIAPSKPSWKRSTASTTYQRRSSRISNTATPRPSSQSGTRSIIAITHYSTAYTDGYSWTTIVGLGRTLTSDKSLRKPLRNLSFRVARVAQPGLEWVHAGEDHRA